MTEINDRASKANFMTNGNIESFLKEKEEMLKEQSANNNL